MYSNSHSDEIEVIFKNIDASKKGLTNKEAQIRLKKDGKNILPKDKKDTILKVFLKQFNNPIIYILIITILLSIIINEVVDAVFILFVILVDAILGTIQEWKAEKSAESLQRLIKVTASVLRDGLKVQIDSEELVVGDIVYVDSGDKIPADIRLITTNNLYINEAILTGESVASEKSNDIIEENTGLIDRKNMLYAGTSVVKGRGMGVVIATGINTEIGAVTNKVLLTADTKSPLVIRMEHFTKQIGIFTAIIALIIGIILYIRGYMPREIFFSIVALSVSAIPEGLPVALTLTLSIASNRMAKKNVLVKKLNSVESLGSCTIIASDKTGTLTLNEQTAKKILLPNGKSFEVSGIGYNGIGNVIYKGKKVHNKELNHLALLGVINNEAKLILYGKEWKYVEDSIDVAFLALGYKLDITSDNVNVKILGSIPYESVQKYSATFYKDNEKIFCTSKGSLEKILEFCDTMYHNDEVVSINKELLIKQNNLLAKEGYRVIAIAKGQMKNDVQNKDYKNEDIPKLTFVGMVGFIDPIRKEVIPAIKKCQEAGIKTVMITGDHPLTAFHIAKELKITTKYDEVTTGIELEEYLKKGSVIFDKFIKSKKVFTRVNPNIKYEIVESYKRQGEFIAVTGDGVNDAPALKSANIGIAMGSGTDVAKETSSMIITDDNFLSIVLGVEEGRNAYNNVRKVIYMLLSSGVAEVLFVILSIVFGYPMPLIAVQLLWLNLVTDGLQDVALAFEKGEPNVMKEKPRKPHEKIFNKLLLQGVLLSGISTGLIIFGLWTVLLSSNVNVITARSYILLLMVFMQNIHVLNCRSETRSIFKIPFKDNPMVIIVIISTLLLQVFVINSEFFSNILKLTIISWTDALKIFVLALPILLIMEIFKFVKKKKLIC
ncbi:MAG: HAD-IC family P-type ATPase [Bacilli bacterium]